MHRICRAVCVLTVAIFSVISLPSAFAKDKEYTIVIDAGHGGHDVGAVDNGVKEKDINLGVALKAGEMIQKKLKNVKVVYTRNNDTFLSLQERADKANKAKGDLFISVHTNSVDKSNKNRASVCGASVYTLGLHKDQNNMDVARRENAVIRLEKNFEQTYSGFDPQSDESYIIFELAQKGNLGRSIKFARQVQNELVNVAGRKDRGVHQAGFWVLWATSMPAVLIELDFICNPTSAEFISSSDGQDKLARAIFNAVKDFTENSKTASYDAVPEQVSTPTADNVLASTERKVRNDCPTVAATESGVATGKRRRRSQAAKVASDNRDVTIAEIPLNTDSSAFTLAQAEPEVESAPVKQTTEMKVVADDSKPVKKKKGEMRTYGGKQVMVADNAVASNPVPAKAVDTAKTQQSRTKSHAKVEKLHTVYKIQLLASTIELDNNYPGFNGLKPDSFFRENNMYKYTYGHSESRAEIERLLKDVKEKLPHAFIISTKESTSSAK